MTREDVDWVRDVAIERYSERYDRKTTEGWLRNHVLPNPLLFMATRTDHAFAVSHFYTYPWTSSEFEVEMMFLCSTGPNIPWDALALCRDSIEWAKFKGTKRWRIAS